MKSVMLFNIKYYKEVSSMKSVMYGPWDDDWDEDEDWWDDD